MDIQSILNTTKNFYEIVGTEFSNTRQYSWKGWSRALEKIELKEDSKILDLGCGNGRFYNFLKENLKINFEYIGLDIDKELLNTATKKYPKIVFENMDIFNDIDSITNRYDLVVGFGITHHIPNKEFRMKWFENVARLVESRGYVILSFWNFLDKKSLITASELEKNDYWLGWNNLDVKRYCHYYDEKELTEIDNIFMKNEFDVLNTNNDLADRNLYKVYKKK